MRFAYADPPYPGQSKAHYEDHPDYAGEVDHAELVERLVGEYPDGWALSTISTTLRDVLNLCPPETRVMAWVKPFCSWRGAYPPYAWEPVLMCGGRKPAWGEGRARDWVSATPPAFRGEKGVPGMKPLEFCLWLFDCLGAQPEDTLDDLFPGSGAVARAWVTFCAQGRLVIPAAASGDPLFGEEAA